MELTKELGTIFIETAQELKGYASRIFKAKVVKGLGKGGQRRAEEELGWNRGTIRKGMAELEGNFAYLDNFRARGRKPTEAHLPNLLDDIKSIADRLEMILQQVLREVTEISPSPERYFLLADGDPKPRGEPTGEKKAPFCSCARDCLGGIVDG